MDPIETFDAAAAAADRIVARLAPEQFAAPTPCAEWDVRGVLNHVHSGHLMAVALLSDLPLPDRTADRLGEDPLAAYRAAVAAVRAALAEPGAFGKLVSTPLGERPGAVLAHMRANEMLVHGWDIARATGQSTDIAPELAEDCLRQWAERFGEAPRGGNAFGEQRAAPAGATAADRLAAFLGREV